MGIIELARSLPSAIFTGPGYPWGHGVRSIGPGLSKWHTSWWHQKADIIFVGTGGTSVRVKQTTQLLTKFPQNHTYCKMFVKMCNKWSNLRIFHKVCIIISKNLHTLCKFVLLFTRGRILVVILEHLRYFVTNLFYRNLCFFGVNFWSKNCGRIIFSA